MILNSNRKLQVVLTTSKTTNDLPIIVDYIDWKGDSSFHDSQTSQTNGTTAVDFAFAPDIQTKREITLIQIYNRDTAAKTVQLSMVDNGVSLPMQDVTLQVDDVLTYTDEGAWKVTDVNGNVKSSASTSQAATVITSASASAFAVGLNGTTNPAFVVDSSAAVQAAGLKVAGAAAAGTVALSVISSGADAGLSIAAKGAGVLSIADAVSTHTPVAINATATATAAQVATGYITSTSAAPVTITLPTGALLGTALGAAQGTIHDLFIDNTAGANTVTIAVAVGGVLSAAAVAGGGAGAGLLTVPAGATGQACFRLMFSSASTYTFSRIA